MTYTRKQVVTCLSVVYLVIATGLGGYASSRSSDRSVPISGTLTGLTTALPIVAGLLLEGGYDLTRSQERRQRLDRSKIQRPPLVIIANTIIFIYSTAVITLLGTHAAPPSGLHCGLLERWQKLFKSKNSDAIRKIQDAFNCCGLTNPRDMAWPFPDRNHDQHACESAFGRSNGCLAAWKAEEQQVAGLLIGMVAMVFIWQLAIIAIPTQKESWLHKVAPERISRMIADERHGDTEPRSAIDYIPSYNGYSDRIEQIEGEEDDTETERGAEGGNRTPTRPITGNEESGQLPSIENEWART
ncbi:hypothetical protein BDU57DRAFT_595354 [Ampelomyces quisqualis]|uniref:Tetraspanin Tsp3 n=1 Tax=Ampelomyces quisqualis TaxID=50730 RepID=A0A6A5QLW9_AMPQU|nr:hypothetical protein BDU57DRAFT_595354 [Ampelomyces quisqualis]